MGYGAFLRWVLIASISLVGIFVCWSLGLFVDMYALDATKLSVVIVLAFIFMSCWCGVKTFNMSNYERELDLSLRKGDPGYLTHNQLVKEDIADATSKEEIGWFISESLLSIGMIGTIVGFMMMLGGFAGGAIDPSNVGSTKELLFSISNGMSTALITTLTGIICSQLLKFQYMNYSNIIARLEERMERVCGVEYAKVKS